MKRTLLTLATIATFLISLQSNAQSKQPLENSLLWEISGNGLQKSSYLYGTIHMICEKDFSISEKLKNTISKTTRLTLEVDLSDPNELQEMQKSAMGEIPLSKELTSQQYKSLDSILTLKTPMTLKQLDNFNLMGINSILIASTLPCKSLKVYEFELIALAKQQKMTIGKLETIKDQAYFFSKAFNKDFLFTQLIKTDSYGEMFIKMIDDYKNERLTDIGAKLNDERFSNADTKKWLLTERNLNWVSEMPSMMKAESVFFAVGAAHLPGENGVIELLKAKGYTVKPVLN
ncbi:TraB family protein [compost metagenome]